MKIYALLILSLLLFSGCGMKTNEYSASSKNIHSLKKRLTKKIALTKFSAKIPNQNQIMCRLGDYVNTPNKESFETYIQNALKEELLISNLYDENSNIKISGVLDEIDAKTMGEAYWKIHLVLTSSNGNKIRVETKFSYEPTLLAFTACNNMANTFSVSVRELVQDIIMHPDFNTLY